MYFNKKILFCLILNWVNNVFLLFYLNASVLASFKTHLLFVCIALMQTHMNETFFYVFLSKNKGLTPEWQRKLLS